jgi:large conductance mechanosensitive channel
MWAEFRKFIARGNVLDMAVGIIVGAAFTTVVKSLVDDIIMPPIGRLTGGVDFSDLYINLSGGEYASLADAKAAGAATINYGLFLNNVISFLIVAFAVFLLVRGYNRLVDTIARREQEEAEAAAPAPQEMECPYCRFTIPITATRCGHCTSELQPTIAR